MPRLRALARARPALRIASLFLSAALAAACASDGGSPQEPQILYKWVDRNGIAHYTTDPDRIPSNLRDRIHDLDEEPRWASDGPADAARTAAVPPAGARSQGGAAGPAAAGSGSGGGPAAENGTATPAPEAPGESVARPALRESPEAAAPGGRGPEPEGSTPAPAPAAAAPAPAPPPSSSRAVASAAPIQADPGASDRRRELDARIAALEAELAATEERLKTLISEAPPASAQGTGGDPVPLYRSEELESLARTFPQLQADLAALRAERRRLETGP